MAVHFKHVCLLPNVYVGLYPHFGQPVLPCLVSAHMMVLMMTNPIQERFWYLTVAILCCLAEQQFVEVLLKRKEGALAAALPSVKPLFQQDLIIDIEMWHVKPRIWRRFKVSGGMTLAVLQDKIQREGARERERGTEV